MPDEVEALCAVVLASLTERDRAAHATYTRAEVVAGGGTVEVAGLTLTASGDFVVAFVDEAPGGNWSHPCRYVVATGDGTTDTPAGWPPVMGPLPEPWHLLHRGDSVEDWQLLPMKKED